MCMDGQNRDILKINRVLKTPVILKARAHARRRSGMVGPDKLQLGSLKASRYGLVYSSSRQRLRQKLSVWYNLGHAL